eukprot:811261-Karenia_brevis.AAC.1
MDDGQSSCPPLLKSDDEDPFDPFAAMCEDSPRSAYDADAAAAQGATGSQQSTWQPPPPPPRAK